MDKEMEARKRQAYSEIQDLLGAGVERWVMLDMYELPENLTDVAVKGPAIFIADAQIDGAYQSAIVESPRWVDVAVLANNALIELDTRFCNFFAGIIKVSESMLSDSPAEIDGVPVYEIILEH